MIVEIELKKLQTLFDYVDQYAYEIERDGDEETADEIRKEKNLIKNEIIEKYF